MKCRFCKGKIDTQTTEIPFCEDCGINFCPKCLQKRKQVAIELVGNQPVCPESRCGWGLGKKEKHPKGMVLEETIVMNDVLAFVRECDADELAGLYGQIYGFDVSVIDGKYHCSPNTEYCGHRKEQLKKS